MNTVPSPSSSGAPSPIVRAKRRRRLRLLILTVLLAAALAWLLPVGLNLAVPESVLRALVENSLTGAAGRRVVVSGPIRFTSLPFLGISIGALTVKDAPEFGGGPFLEVRRAAVGLRLIPLLSRTLAPSDITVSGLTLNIKRDAEGRPNWDGMPFLTDAAAFTPDEETAGSWKVEPRPRGMRLSDAAVTFDDKLTGRSGRLTGLNLHTGYGERFTFTVSCKAALGAGPSADVHFQGQALYDPESARLDVRDGVLEAGLVLPDPTGSSARAPLRAALRAKVEYAGGKGLLTLRDLDARALDARLTGEAALADVAGSLRLSGHVNLRAAAGGQWALRLGFVAEPADQQRLVQEEPTLEDPGMPKAVLVAAPDARPDDVVLETDFDLASNRIALQNAALRRGGAELAGEAACLLGPNPTLQFSLRGDSLDGQALLPPNASGKWSLPPALPGNLKVSGSLRLGELLMRDLRLADVSVSLGASRGQARFYPVSARLPGGLVNADLRLEPEAGALRFEAEAEAVLLPTESAVPAEGKEERPPQILTLSGLLAHTGIQGRLVATDLDPAGWRALFTPDQKNDAPPRPLLSGEAAFAASPGDDRLVAAASVSDMKLRLGETGLFGSLRFENGTASRVILDMEIDRLDALPLLALANAESDHGTVSNLPEVEGRVVVRDLDSPVGRFRNLSLSGRARADLLTVDELAGEFQAGRLSGSFEAGLDPKNRRLTLEAQASGANAASLTAALFGKTLAAGAADLTCKLAGSGKTAEAFRTSLQARLGLNFPKGGRFLPGETDKAKGGAAFSTAAAEVVLKGKTGQPQAMDLTASLDFAAPGPLRKGRLTIAGPAALDPEGRPLRVENARLEAAVETVGPSGQGLERSSLAGALFVGFEDKSFKTQDLSLSLSGAQTSGALNLSGTWAETPSFKAGLRLPAFSPRTILAWLDLRPPDNLPENRLRSGSLSLDALGTAKGLTLKNVALAVDDLSAKGEIVFPGYNPAKGKYDFHIPDLDLDALLPPQAGNAPKGPAEPFNLEALRSLDLEAKLRIGRLVKSKLVWKDAEVECSGHGGHLKVIQKAKDFYGGQFAGDFTGDARDVTLKSLLELKIEGFDGPTFLRDWVEGEIVHSGTITFVLSLRSNGADETAMRRNLGGSFRFQIVRGSLLLKGSTPERPSPTLEKEPMPHAVARPDLRPPPPKDDTLPFEVFASSFTVREGVAYTEDFVIEGKKVRIKGKGTVDLRNETVDLSLIARGEDEVDIPVTVVGPMDNTDVKIDRSAMVGDMLYRLLKGVVSLPGKTLLKTLSPLRYLEDAMTR